MARINRQAARERSRPGLAFSNSTYGAGCPLITKPEPDQDGLFERPARSARLLHQPERVEVFSLE